MAGAHRASFAPEYVASIAPKDLADTITTVAGFANDLFDCRAKRRCRSQLCAPIDTLSDMGAPRSRRDWRCELFTGAFGELRNPKAHQDPTITDPPVAVEEMMVASTLPRIVDCA